MSKTSESSQGHSAERDAGAPNIRTDRGDHERYCTKPRFAVQEWGHVGDVRRCEHGRIILGYEVPGTVPPYWLTLHPFWTPIRYRRAVRALTSVTPPARPAQ